MKRAAATCTSASPTPTRPHLAPWLPVLLALSANSPFADDLDTGYHRWRAVRQSRFPGSGIAPYFRSHNEHLRAVDTLVTCGVLVDRNQTFWLARLSASAAPLSTGVLGRGLDCLTPRCVHVARRPDCGTPGPAADLVRELIGHVADALEHAADRAFAEAPTLALLADGTGSVAQRAAATAGLPAVLRLLAGRTVPATGHEAATAG